MGLRSGPAAGLVLLILLVAVAAAATYSCRRATAIHIISENLSHRVVLLDQVELRLKLLVGFEVTGKLPPGPTGTKAHGTLSREGAEIASFTMPRLDHSGGNLVFYLPFDIAPGDYDLDIELSDLASGTVLATKHHTVENIERKCARQSATCNWMTPASVPRQDPPAEELGAEPTAEDLERGFILWHRHPFRYVYPGSAPDSSEVVTSVSVRLARNEFEPATFSLYALQALASVTVEVSDLRMGDGTTVAAPEVRVVKSLPRYRTRAADSYELRPRLLEKGSSAVIEAGRAQRFWLTFHAPPSARPGQYDGTITLTAPSASVEVPLSMEILPFALTERPDKEYGFMMTYEFQEMTAQDLTDQERARVYENGVKYLRSHMEHGLTMVFPHSSFAFRRLPDGSPDLRDLEAAVAAFTEVGFAGPFVYYCGHLVQSSKPDWAGSTLGYDEDVHPLLMQEIIAYARKNFAAMQSIDFYWMPADEAHDDRGGPDRKQIADQLLYAVREVGEQTAVTMKDRVAWPLDIKLVARRWGDEHPLHGESWEYPNGELFSDSMDDAERARRAYGLSHVASHHVGIAPWTFQTSENANGDPYTDLDTQGSPEVMLAYPGTDGPTLTPEYEAVREGIDDGRYGYLLESHIESAGQSTDPNVQALAQEAAEVYQGLLEQSGDANLAQMDADRETMIDWILAIDAADQIPVPLEQLTAR